MHLRYVNKLGISKDIELTGEPLSIGRSREADIPLLDDKVSRVHCGIRLSDGEFYLKDLKSRNGVFVNGQRVEDTVKLKVGDKVEHVVAEGDGPVNALDAALRKSLENCYPCIREMHLIDYKVRVVNGKAGTAAKVRVVIESRDKQCIWGTVGVSENIVEASWLALVDSVEYKIHRSMEQAD